MHDLAIIGAGPAGLNAAIYAARYGLKAVVIGSVPGGLVSATHEIANWLGTEKISGQEFVLNMLKQVESYKTPIIQHLVSRIEKTALGFTISILGAPSVEAKTILLALGTSHRQLGVPGEKKFMGKGVSYCATCDGFFFKNKTVTVVGGDNAAVAAAAYLSDITSKVYLICRNSQLSAEGPSQASVNHNSKIEILFDTNITEIIGPEKVTAIETHHSSGVIKTLATDGVFIEIGSEPNSELISELNIEVDEQNFVKVGPDGTTSIDGIWAAGDLTNGSNGFRQIITAAAEGAIASVSIQKYLKQTNSRS